MARIRSFHPWLWTDERFVSVSPMARLLYLGLHTEADDQGLLERRPVQLKMRLFPADAVDVAGLLEELFKADLVAPLETAGLELIAIRDFRTWQRPKKPNAIHQLPPEWAPYVGLGAVGSEPGEPVAPPVRDRFPTGSELPPQMEEEGGRKKGNPPRPPGGSGRDQVDRQRISDLAAAEVDPGLEASIARILRALPMAPVEMSSEELIRSAVIRIVADGVDHRGLTLAVESFCAQSHLATDNRGRFMGKAHEWLLNKRASLARHWPSKHQLFIDGLSHEDKQWLRDVQQWKRHPSSWSRRLLGPEPDKPGCQVPSKILGFCEVNAPLAEAS